METVDNIQKIKKRYIDTLYAQTRQEQRIDQEYRDDTFPVPEIKPPHKVWRSGMGSRMVDAPAEQIVTSNPQVNFNVLKGRKDIEKKLSKEVNEKWIELLRLSNPNVFKESVKNKLCRGESYVKVCHNERWVTNPTGRDSYGLPLFERMGIPIIFDVPDPMVIYGSPEEDDCGWIPNSGVPNKVLVFYKRQPEELILRYPSWTNPKNKEKDIEWLEFWDKNTMYFEAEGETIVHTNNPYKFTPFVRKYSGFGRRSPEGELADLIVSDIRFSRDLIRQECVTRSNNISVEQIYAHAPKDIMQDGLHEAITKKDLAEIGWGEYGLNVLPPGASFAKNSSPSVTPEMYQNHIKIISELMQRHPFIAAGSPYAPSAREGDRSFTAAMRRYDSLVENTENEWATVIAMGLVVCKEIPTLRPDGLTKEDLDAIFKVTVKLRAKDPIEEDRLITLGDRLRRGDGITPPAISLEMFHTKFMGMTQAESEKEQIGILVDQATFNNPNWVQMVSGAAIEEGSMEDVMARFGQAGQQGQVPKTTVERTQGEGQPGSPTEGTRGARQSPSRYTRGG